ncbi:nitroreductase family protein [Patescibacteria group bacterium]
MKLEELIKKRRSIRSYKNKKVSKKLIKEILKLANLAPTAASEQNRQFIVVDNKKIKEEVFKAGCQQEYISEAPIAIIVTTNMQVWQAKKLLKKNEQWGMDFWGAKTNNYKNSQKFLKNLSIWKNLWSLQDADAATTILLLAATAKGLGACWLGCFDHQKISQILKLPPNTKPIALITLGYIKNKPYPQKRKKIEELLYWNHWKNNK